MPDGESTNQSPFDLDRLLALVELMEKHGLTEVSLKRGDEAWRLRRGYEPSAGPAAYPATAAAAQSAASPGSAGPGEKGPKVDDGTVTINSPTVGTFYAAPAPDDPSFVSVGMRVEYETVVCVVEAMKVFNQIPAEVSGTIVAVLVKNGDSVEFGQPLFRVRPG